MLVQTGVAGFFSPFPSLPGHMDYLSKKELNVVILTHLPTNGYDLRKGFSLMGQTCKLKDLAKKKMGPCRK